MTSSARRLLLVHAHPDDEAITCGATMARYVAEGAGVTLVTCTLGEEGEILVPELAGLAAGEADQLGGYRIGELAAAMRQLGVTDHRFLGGAGRFRDSGMMGTPANEHPRCFWRADVDAAAALLAEVIREVRPQVLLTYDQNGGYGHPDHIQTHRVAMRAVELAAAADHGDGEPWQVAKVYWTTMPRSAVQAGLDKLRQRQAAGEVADGESFFGMESADDLPSVRPDEDVTAAIDATAYVDQKMAALAAHATQISVDGPFFALSNNIGQEIWGVEYFALVRGDRGPGAGPHGWETDLFAGLD